MKYLICNLKSNKTYGEMLEYREEIRLINTNTNIIFAPGDIYLSLFKGTGLSLCTQNLDLKESLEITGNTTIKQLKSLGVSYALVGHFERRKYYNESEREIIFKIKDALANGLKVIYFIGESKEELERKVEYQVIERMLARVLNEIPKEEFKNIIIAYEPTYLIGTNTTYDLIKINEMINFIKHIINNYYDMNIDIVFGGNINPNNIEEFKNIRNLDGFVLGYASLNPTNIKEILEKMTP